MFPSNRGRRDTPADAKAKDNYIANSIILSIDGGKGW